MPIDIGTTGVLQCCIESVICILFNHSSNHNILAFVIESELIFVSLETIQSLWFAHIVAVLSNHNSTSVQQGYIAGTILKLLFSHFKQLLMTHVRQLRLA